MQEVIPVGQGATLLAGADTDCAFATGTRLTRRQALASAAGAFVMSPGVARAAADQLRVGKTIINSFPMAGVDVGKEAGIFASENIDVIISAFRGDGQIQQALTAGALDIGFGSGPGMGYASKGVPAHAVAVMANAPRNMCLVVPKSGPVKTVADLKGQKIGVSTAGSLTDWLVRAIAVREGWGPDGIQTVPMGEVRTRNIAMKAGELQGSITAIEEGYDFEGQGAGKILMNFGEITPDFITHAIFATDALIDKNPDLVRRFLRAWFKTVIYIRDNRAAAVRIIARATNYSEAIVDQSYDTEMSMISFDGSFSPKAVETIRASLKDLGIADSAPEASTMFDPRFTPVKL